MEVVDYTADIAVVSPPDPCRLLAHLSQTVKWFSAHECKDGVGVRQFVSWVPTTFYFDFILMSFFYVSGSCQCVHVSSFVSLSIRLSSGLQGKPLSWAVLVQDRQIKVLLSSGPEIYILDDTSCCEVVRQTDILRHL